MDRKWVYLFTELEAAEATQADWEGVRALLGGKGANLAEMSRIGVPVPPGFTVTTEACIAYLAEEGHFPPDIWEQALEALKAIEKTTGKEFGNPKKPLLVSCRSGAKFSMPGMMDTILNIGLNDEVAEGMVKLTGDPRFVYDAYRRLINMFGDVVMGIDHEHFELAATATGATGRCELSPPADSAKNFPMRDQPLRIVAAGRRLRHFAMAVHHVAQRKWLERRHQRRRLGVDTDAARNHRIELPGLSDAANLDIVGDIGRHLEWK